MKIDFDGVQAFVEVADQGSFTRAASRLHITRTALTRRVQNLEAYLGVTLLERTTRTVSITAPGRDFLPQARALVDGMGAAIQRMKEMSRTSSGSFTLACVPSMAGRLLPDLMRRYAALHPDNRIEVIDANSDEVRHAVLHHQAEFGIALHAESGRELVERTLFDDPLVFVCHPTHPLHRRETVSWRDLRGTDLIVVGGSTTTRVVMDYQLTRHGIDIHGRYGVQHHATAIKLVTAGIGGAVLPASALGPEDRPPLRAIPLVSPTVRRKVVLVRRRGAILSPPAKAFVALLRSVDLASPA